MSDGMRRELAYLSSHATNRYFIPNWGPICIKKDEHTQERDFSSSRCAIYLFVVAAISKMIWS